MNGWGNRGSLSRLAMAAHTEAVWHVGKATITKGGQWVEGKARIVESRAHLPDAAAIEAALDFHDDAVLDDEAAPVAEEEEDDGVNHVGRATITRVGESDDDGDGVRHVGKATIRRDALMSTEDGSDGGGGVAHVGKATVSRVADAGNVTFGDARRQNTTGPTLTTPRGLVDGLRRDGAVVIGGAFPPEKVELFRKALPLFEAEDPRLQNYDFEYPDSVTAVVAALLGADYEAAGAPEIAGPPRFSDGVDAFDGWRRAIAPLFDDATTSSLPPVELRALIALEPLSEGVGATEFRAGSHALPTAAGLKRPPLWGAAAPGSIVLYDARVLSRAPAPPLDGRPLALAVRWRRAWFSGRRPAAGPAPRDPALPVREYYAA